MTETAWPTAEGVQTSLSRIGVVDVGSNSVRLVVFDGVARAPSYFYNEKVLCGLGKGVVDTGQLHPEGRRRAFRAIARFVALARLMRLSRLEGVATAAVREARDGAEFVARVEAETGLKLRIASGPDEGELAAKGVLLGWPKATGLVCDIGGASLEVAALEEGRIGARATAPIGPLRLADLGGTKAENAAIKAGLAALKKAVPAKPKRVFLVGGSWRAIAKLDMERRKYPLRVLHEYDIPVKEMLATCDHIAETDTSRLKEETDSSAARMELVPTAARVLAALIESYGPSTFSISSYGLREGVLYDLMPEGLRARDPLIEAARHMEASAARFPGFGDALYAWLAPIAAAITGAPTRLVRAACLLHDIAWRAHPDYRADVSFETVTRANLTGLDHAERVFLGLAIMHRYRSGGVARFEPDLLELLSEDLRKEASVLGRALRLGAMLTGAAPGALQDTRIHIEDDALCLTMSGSAITLGGEAVERRLAALANRLDLKVALRRT
ncbi:MAG: Ppx/GppA family phosphatase [Pseudomonadota bacterium]